MVTNISASPRALCLQKQWSTACMEKLKTKHIEQHYGRVIYIVPDWVPQYNVDVRLYAVAKFDYSDPNNITYTLP